MTHPVTSFARKAHYLVSRIEGPVAWTAILDLKGLHKALGLKIEELECQSTAATAIIPTGKAQATSGCVSRLPDTEPDS